MGSIQKLSANDFKTRREMDFYFLARQLEVKANGLLKMLTAIIDIFDQAGDTETATGLRAKLDEFLKLSDEAMP
jgi:hypothetical protein